MSVANTDMVMNPTSPGSMLPKKAKERLNQGLDSKVSEDSDNTILGGVTAMKLHCAIPLE